MSEHTKIEWCDHTFNPWIGCTRVSPACDHCYAEALNRRWGHDNWGAGVPRRRTSEANWRQPLAWNRKAERDGVRRRVFCASLADVFDAEVADEWRVELMGLIRETPSLDWLLLTKRPQVAKKFFDVYDTYIDPPQNIWLGTTVENQAMADLRIPVLRAISARVHFLSCEPLLGPVDLSAWRWAPNSFWVIAGGESGPHARPAHPDWFRSLRDQCQAAGVPFFFKQWGEWAPGGMVWRDGKYVDQEALGRVGKKAAGAMLDGREWREFPT